MDWWAICCYASFLVGFAPLLRLSPPPAEQDYFFNLEDTEGVCDLFDVPSTGTAIPFGQTA